MSEDELRQVLARNPGLRVQGLDPPKSGKPGSGPRILSREFDSDAEQRYYEKRVLPPLQTGLLLCCELHKAFEIVPALEHCGRKYKNRIYTPDFYLEYQDGSVEVVEIKGRKIKKLQRDYPLRRQLFILNYCIPNNWRFMEVHDDEI